MGSFFTNYLVRTRDLQAVASATERIASADGWTPVADEVAPVRHVAHVPAGDWIAVYDELTESQDVDRWAGGAQQLARVLGVPVLATLVHDSDALDLRMFDATGELLGFLYSAPDGRQINEGGYRPWRALFPAIADIANELTAAITAEHVFIDDALRAIADLLALPPAIMTGYRYAADAGFPANTQRVLLAPVTDPAWTAPAIGTVHATAIELAPGDTGTWTATYRNFGAPAEGLHVSISDLGGVAAVESITIAIGAAGTGGVHTATPTASTDGNLDATFPEALVPSGASRARLQQLRLLGHAWFDVAMPPFIELRVTLRAAGRAGTVTLAAYVSALNGGTKPALHAVGCTVGTLPPPSAKEQALLDAMFVKADDDA